MTMLEQETRTEREEQVANLRSFANFLEANPNLKSPFDDSGERFLVCLSWAEDPKAELAKWARATSHLHPAKKYDGTYAALNVDFGGIALHVFAKRELVCDRIVTGTSTVTKTVKDPAALAAVPEVEVTEEVELVEWVCGPLLAVSA
jgi:hypothetical protein